MTEDDQQYHDPFLPLGLRRQPFMLVLLLFLSALSSVLCGPDPVDNRTAIGFDLGQSYG